MITRLKWIWVWFLLTEPVLVFNFGDCLPFAVTIEVQGQPLTSIHECVASSRDNERGLLPIGTHFYFLNAPEYALGGTEKRLEGWITGYQATWTIDNQVDYGYIVRYFNQQGSVPLMKEFVMDSSEVSNL